MVPRRPDGYRRGRDGQTTTKGGERARTATRSGKALAYGTTCLEGVRRPGDASRSAGSPAGRWAASEIACHGGPGLVGGGGSVGARAREMRLLAVSRGHTARLTEADLRGRWTTPNTGRCASCRVRTLSTNNCRAASMRPDAQSRAERSNARRSCRVRLITVESWDNVFVMYGVNGQQRSASFPPWPPSSLLTLPWA